MGANDTNDKMTFTEEIERLAEEYMLNKAEYPFTTKVVMDSFKAGFDAALNSELVKNLEAALISVRDAHGSEVFGHGVNEAIDALAKARE